MILILIIQESTHPSPLPLPGGEVRRQESGGKKEEERAVEGESFLVTEQGTEFYRALLLT
ncbi:MAG: hypothetical protein F6K18_06260 [Okeania sp. SIO2C2]|uniref:hypothetical protein n=1 Tax=Okeania sp. SIO2C2 TaxID=2607787 RepID=UPI0013BADC0C|nr:hypothetical protein [Okeania sp. SIO2C2]NEP86460.1 hypothetical protein [Okeania sp. SIO2C2]